MTHTPEHPAIIRRKLRELRTRNWTKINRAWITEFDDAWTRYVEQLEEVPGGSADAVRPFTREDYAEVPRPEVDQGPEDEELLKDIFRRFIQARRFIAAEGS